MRDHEEVRSQLEYVKFQLVDDPNEEQRKKKTIYIRSQLEEMKEQLKTIGTIIAIAGAGLPKKSDRTMCDEAHQAIAHIRLTYHKIGEMLDSYEQINSNKH